MMRLFGAEPGMAYDWVGRYSIAPSTRVPIVCEWRDEGELHRDIDEARWRLRRCLGSVHFQ